MGRDQILVRLSSGEIIVDFRKAVNDVRLPLVMPSSPPAHGAVHMRAFRADDVSMLQDLATDPYVPMTGTLASVLERGKHDLGEPTSEFVLKAGDCAYVPRGMVHDASTSGEGPSLHITCGLIVKTWAEVILEAVSEVALSEVEFRRSLPPGFAHRDFDRTQAEAIFARLMQILPERAVMGNAFDLMVDSFIRSRDSDIAGAVVSGSLPLDPVQAYVLKPTIPWRLAEDGDNLVLIAPGGDLDIKEAEQAAYRRALSGQPFVLADLGIDGADKMLRRLIAFGVVETT